MALTRKIATIDLNRRTVDQTPIPVEWRRRFLGGRGLSAYLFCKDSPRDCDPEDGGNVAVVSAGLLAGTLSAPLGYTVVMGRSPQTGLMTWACLDGPFSSEMRQAGFDHLILKGRAKRPVSIFIDNGDIKIKDARNLLGKGLGESREMIREAAGGKDVRILCTDIADGDQVRVADLSLRLDAAADRKGFGSIFGIKNVKAIACRGTLDIEIKDPGGIIQYERSIRSQTPPAISPQDKPGNGAVSGVAGKVTSRELEEILAQSLGIFCGNGAEPGRPFFETAAAQVRLNTGLDLDGSHLKAAAYRCLTLERLFNLREGVTGKSGGIMAFYRKEGWTRMAVVKKGKVFDRLGIGELWPLFR